MSRKVEIRLYKHPDEMSDEALTTTFKGQKADEIVRVIVKAEIKYVREHPGSRQQRTLRGFWYDIVKIALSRGGQLNRTTDPNRGKGNAEPLDWASKLSSELTKLVIAGETSYEELSIIDGSRQRHLASSITATVERITYCGPHYPGVVIFTEKDTIWSIIENIAQLYGVSALSGGGEPALSCTEPFIKEIMDHPNFDGKLVLIGLTDYDLSGQTIYNSQRQQIENLFPDLEIDAVRIGVNPDQLTPAELDTRTYDPKPGEKDKWFQLTRMDKCIELDALGITRIRKLFATEIEKRIDLDLRCEDLREGFIQEIISDHMRPNYLAEKARLIDLVKSSDAWTEIEDTPIPDETFTDEAVSGSFYVNPKDIFGHEIANAIKAVLAEA